MFKDYHYLVVLELTNNFIFEWHCQTILREYFHVTILLKSFVETGNGRILFSTFLLLL